MGIVKQWIQERGIEEVEALVPDMAGTARGKFIPAGRYNEDEGIRLAEMLFSQTVTGDYVWETARVNPADIDMRVLPDPDSMRVVPWAPCPTAQIIHECFYANGKPVPIDHPLSFAKADLELCFNQIDKRLRMPNENLRFPTGDLKKYSRSYNEVRCVVMQGGQGEVKHWAFNDPPKRAGKFRNAPPSPAEYMKLTTRVTDLHPMTVIQNARTSGGGNVAGVPRQAITVGPVQTWQAEKVSIWHAGTHDNPFGQRLTTLMISKKIADSAVPMSLLALHPNVQFNYFRGGIGRCEVEMH